MELTEKQEQARENFYQELRTLFPHLFVYGQYCMMATSDGGVACLKVSNYSTVDEWKENWLPEYDIQENFERMFGNA